MPAHQALPTDWGASDQPHEMCGHVLGGPPKLVGVSTKGPQPGRGSSGPRSFLLCSWRLRKQTLGAWWALPWAPSAARGPPSDGVTLPLAKGHSWSSGGGRGPFRGWWNPPQPSSPDLLCGRVVVTVGSGGRGVGLTFLSAQCLARANQLILGQMAGKAAWEAGSEGTPVRLSQVCAPLDLR